MEACDIRDEASADPVWKQWHEYRATCFLNVANTQVWIYTAAEEFDCQVAMLHLLEVPGVALDAGSHAISISAFGDFHVIPISRLDSRSISILRPNVEGDIGQRKVELLRDEGCSASSLREKTRQRYAGLLGPVAGQGMH